MGPVQHHQTAQRQGEYNTPRDRPNKGDLARHAKPALTEGAHASGISWGVIYRQSIPPLAATRGAKYVSRRTVGTRAKIVPQAGASCQSRSVRQFEVPNLLRDELRAKTMGVYYAFRFSDSSYVFGHRLYGKIPVFALESVWGLESSFPRLARANDDNPGPKGGRCETKKRLLRRQSNRRGSGRSSYVSGL